MKHDRVPSLGVLREGGGWVGGRGRGGGGCLQKESTPCEVGAVCLGVKLQGMEDVRGPVGVNRQALGPWLEVDVSLRDTEGGAESRLEEGKKNIVKLVSLEIGRKLIGNCFTD